MLAKSLGCYVGEVLVRETGARWHAKEQDAKGGEASSFLQFPRILAALPWRRFVRCCKGIKNGAADGIAVWAGLLVAMQKEATA